MLNFLQVVFSLQHKHTQAVLAYTSNQLHHSYISSYNTITQKHFYHLVSSVHWVMVAANQRGRECGFLPLGLIYCSVLGSYCTDLLLRPEVNCPALGSISNRTARDMGPDTSKRWHYIIPCCFGKWSQQTPPYNSLIIQKKEAGIRRPGMSSPRNVPAEIQLIYHDKAHSLLCSFWKTSGCVWCQWSFFTWIITALFSAMTSAKSDTAKILQLSCFLFILLLADINQPQSSICRLLC